MATKLSILNGALAELGLRELTSLSDPQEARRVLTRIWDNGFVEGCLEQGSWNFATRTVKATDDPPAPSFGYDYRVQKPNDWIRTLKISTNGSFNPLLNEYSDEGGYWYCNHDEIYVQYISSHPSYGGNISNWPRSFVRFVELQLAVLAAPRFSLQVTQALEERLDKALKNAKSKDAQNQPPEFPPMGSWARSRYHNRFNPNEQGD